MLNRERIATAYDSVAADYDRRLARDAWIRRALWRHFDRLFDVGDRLIDAGCGTGLDTFHLASRGVMVTAVDASEGMLAELRRKLATAPYGALVDVRRGEVVDLVSDLVGPFDGIISSFAALNTVDLDAFARAAYRLLRPGGRIVCHMLSPGYQRSRGPLAGRRAAPGVEGEATISVGGEPLRHVSLPADQVYRRHFEAHFVRRRAYAVGLVLRREVGPPMPDRLLDLLGRMDVALGAIPRLVSAGRFFVLDLERRAS